MSLSLAIDPETRDMLLDDDGQPVYTDDPTPELILAIGIPLGAVISDPEQGSRLPGFTSGQRPPRSTNEVTQAATDALQRLEQEGLITVEEITYNQADHELTINTAELADGFTRNL